MRYIGTVRLITLVLTVALMLTLYIPVTARAAVSSDITQSGYSAVLYNNSNGLPTSEANAIVQSDNGFIYIGSYSGLIRYDGVNFTRFDSSTGITSVVSLFVDSRSRLWVGTNDSGIALYENGEFTFFNKSSGLTSLSIRSITEDGAGNIVFGTTEGLAYIDSENSLHTLTDSVIDTKYLKRLTRSEDGAIYGCTLDGMCFRLENLKITHLFGSGELGIGLATCITPDPDDPDTVWIGTDESSVVRGRLSQNMNDLSTFSVLPNVNINGVCADGSGEFWICSDNGIGVLDKNGGYTFLDTLPMNNSVEDMMTDYEGNRWFVSSRLGVMKVVRNEFDDISRAAGLDNRVVNTTCLYGDDLYIGTDTGLLVVDGSYRKKTTYLTELLEGVRIRCIKTDSQNRLWLCTYSEKGLICYSGGEDCTCYNTHTGLKSDRIRAMTELSDGTVAAATSAGVVFIKDGEITGMFGEDDGIGNTEILTVCEGENNEIYLGSDGGGIFVIDRNGVINHFGLEDGLRSEIIMRIKKDPTRSGCWVITGNSLAYMENNTVRTLNNFPYSNNFDLFFDNIGRVWILSSSGIYAVSIENLLAGGEFEYSFYDVKCGLPSVATANSRSCLSDDGMLYIAGMTGVSAININKEQTDRNDMKLSIPFVEIDDKTVMVKDGETVTIPADCKRLTIYGYALTFGLSNPRLSYTLEGFDDSKVSVSRQDMQPVSYTNLDHGEYTFRLSVINTLTGEETRSISVNFVKKKAFFEEIWFWGLMVLLSIAAALTALLLYTRIKNLRLIKKQEENRIFVNQIIRAFAKCIDFKDKYTNGHSFRVAKYAALIAERMGYIGQQVTDIYNIGLLHDIGKIAVPDNILGKPGKLTDEEFRIISRHPEHGYKILKEIEIRPELATGAGYHHEHIDGTGYPFGKKGDEIPEVAQIIAVADTFDAMNSTRPYRKQMKMEDIINEMRRIAGTQLNAHIVDVFLEIVSEGHIDDDIALADIVLPDEPDEEQSDETVSNG
ncbi:MAG: HD domain-containing protein [Ruminococcaceae bacterium]|nr:HD domain-containing protein [Oscillospiraceae bacterium]